MLQEIRNFIDYLHQDSRGQQKRNRFVIAIIILITLFIINRFVLFQYISDDLVVRFHQSKFLFLNNLSPYDEDVQKYLVNSLSDLSLAPNSNMFDLEIALPQLILYFPFSLFKNPIWGKSLFSTISAFSFVTAIFILLKLLKNNYSALEKTFIFVLSLGSLFFLDPFFSGSLSSINFLCCIAVVYFMQEKKLISAGILLGFLSFDIVNIPILIFIFYFGLIKSNKNLALIWALISFILISLSFMIFDRNWMVGWLRNLYFDPQRVPFLTYPQALAMRYGFPTYQIFTIISLLLVIWCIFEIWQTTYNNTKAWFWILGLGGIINYFLFIQRSNTPSIMLLNGLILILSIWHGKISQGKNLVFFGLITTISVATSIFYYVFPLIDKNNFTNIFTLISSFFIVVNLYWVKRWTIVSYGYEELISDN